MIEKAPQNFFSKTFFVLLLVAAFILMYQPWNLSLRELQGNEGFFATNTLEVDFSQYPITTAHKVPARNGYFLYPFMSRLLYDNFSLTIEQATRYTSLFWAFAIALTAGITVWGLRSFKAGLVSFSFFVGVNFVFEKSVLANPTFMALFFVFLAQIFWVYFGFVKTKWNTAWLVSLFLLSIAFLCNGFISLIYFAVPLLFTHRPLKVFSRLSKGGFFVGCVWLTAVILFWGAPYLIGSNHGEIITSIFSVQRLSEWLIHIIYTPFEMIVRLLPWSLIAWLPFCVALRPLDETPVISHYFRVLFFAEFLIALTNPFGNIISIAYSLAPLAVLCGLSYDVGVRRYSAEIRKLLILCSYITTGLAIAVMVYCFMPASLLKDDLPTFALGILFLLQSCWIYFYRKHGQIWLVLLSVSCAIGLFYYATMFKYRIKNRSRSSIGLAIRDGLDRESAKQHIPVIYSVNIGGFYNEGVYINYPINKINSLQELPRTEQVVYLLSPNFPQYPDREWTNLLRENYRQNTIGVWRGELLPEAVLVNRDFDDREEKDVQK
ncbi:MAG: hypothetical protein IKD09_07165 [Lentisphaeria bacterium]|nr:hypothetical protein [Lentisphaeria bacterium]